MTGPLTGVRILEIGGIGPGPFAGMMLADLGADVIRIERPGNAEGDRTSHSILLRGRRSIGVDLKQPRGRDVALRLAASSDALIEGFRPGVMERLGLGPAELLARNPRLVYGRMTGWGQNGPRADRAAHDINYIAVAGALEPIAAPDLTPTAPLNMLGDFGGGGMLLACGLLAALLSARTTGHGQVVDAAIVDGAALLTAMHHSMRASGSWGEARGGNLFDGGAPFYGVYRTADDRWVAVGAIEPAFYAQLLDGLGLTEELASVGQWSEADWPRVRRCFTEVFGARSRDDWDAVFAGTDACVTPVVEAASVADEPHLAARRTYVERGGAVEPMPAPRFGRTPTTLPPPVPEVASDTWDVVAEAGYDTEEIAKLVADGVLTASRLDAPVGAGHEVRRP